MLQLNTSIHAASGESSKLANEFVAGWKAGHPTAKVVVRELALDPVPHLTAERFASFLARPEARSHDQQEIVAYSDALIEELRRADVIVLGLPMYNFGIPSMLKAYFDHIARAGVTFSYTANGPVGLLTGKKVYVFATRGGIYAGTPLDTQTAYVRDFFRFLGITDVEFLYAEGLAIGEASKKTSLAGVMNVIGQMNAPVRIAA